ncbi:PLP-dependent transferase [Myriangium duriaei CBS 260.36]|uniref:PLP-dependent transferase n=1 Tax=Myriangium duriaei CBS 260.36 TaxID=1168546 RepID=A0A9P4MLJ5_9PEZI|nr:PLP-dependent transferase [Myriangium duriaei CBS 260.36]
MVLQRTRSSSAEVIDCGASARKHFLFDADYLNLNHGSFGAIPREVRDVQRHYQDACEAKPDVFIRYTFPRLLSASRSVIASYLSAPKSDVVYVGNATIALNTVLRNLRFAEGDVCIYFSTIYGGIEKTLLYLAESTPLRVHRIPLVYPLTDAEILTTFRNALTEIRAANLTPKIAVYDTVSSLPGVRFPFETLTPLCRKEGVLSCIDAAHCAGQLPINLADLDPDFFVTNLHKWLHVPRPCAILYVPLRHQALMRTSLPTSHGFVPKALEGKVNNPLPSTGEPLSEFEANFEFVGTLDTTAYICVPAALHWRSKLRWQDRVGEEAVMGYCNDQAKAGGKFVADVLRTDVLENEEGSLGKCAFSNVRLPLDYDTLVGGGAIEWNKVVDIARWIEEMLVREHGTFVAVIFHDRSWYVRLSGQVYLTMDDWARASKWLEAVCDRAREKKW